jgi:hypothetical protein
MRPGALQGRWAEKKRVPGLDSILVVGGVGPRAMATRPSGHGLRVLVGREARWVWCGPRDAGCRGMGDDGDERGTASATESGPDSDSGDGIQTAAVDDFGPGDDFRCSAVGPVA